MGERELSRRSVLKYGAAAGGLTAVGGALGEAAISDDETALDRPAEEPISAQTAEATSETQSGCDAVIDASGGGDYGTIQAAVDAAETGDTLCVAPGTYRGTVTLSVDGVTLAPTEQSTVTLSGGDAATDPVLDVTADGVTVDGFEITNPNGARGIDVAGGLVDVTLRNNRVTAIGPVSGVETIGVLLDGNVGSVTIAGNEITDLAADGPNAAAQGIAVRGETSDVVVRRNVFEGITATELVGAAIAVDRGAGGLTVETNDLLTVIGIENADDATVAASCNYWGMRDGPRQVGTNRAADKGPMADERSAAIGSVEFQPWLVQSIQTGNGAQSCFGGR
ncbi:right-handed parallel beta-helix repeat-containing protein [Haloarcula amylovorans]|uniref:right-handed parallel beta-helix repeat-containing protein n=1 Tax=Haloarcula amylovorans TaxID=2562280 RepID=UPI0010761D16|nr:right-handed parallel beta-helix repeat-containing protein [Halomicroarcula amylolytica]